MSQGKYFSDFENDFLYEITCHFSELLILWRNLESKVGDKSNWVPAKYYYELKKKNEKKSDTIFCGTSAALLKRLFVVNNEETHVRFNTKYLVSKSLNKFKSLFTTRTIYTQDFPRQSNLNSILDYFNDYGFIIGLQISRDAKIGRFTCKINLLVVDPEHLRTLLKTRVLRYRNKRINLHTDLNELLYSSECQERNEHRKNHDHKIFHSLDYIHEDENKRRYSEHHSREKRIRH